MNTVIQKKTARRNQDEKPKYIRLSHGEMRTVLKSRGEMQSTGKHGLELFLHSKTLLSNIIIAIKIRFQFC